MKQTKKYSKNHPSPRITRRNNPTLISTDSTVIINEDNNSAITNTNAKSSNKKRTLTESTINNVQNSDLSNEINIVDNFPTTNNSLRNKRFYSENSDNDQEDNSINNIPTSVDTLKSNLLVNNNNAHIQQSQEGIGNFIII
jgi:hypothetical protein